MKRNYLVKALMMVLSFTLIFSMVACGEKEATPGADAMGADEPAADNAAEEDQIIVGVPVYTMEHPYYIELVAAIEAECEAQGVKCITDDANYDAVKQVSIIENMITQGADVLIVAAIDPAGIVPTLEKAMEKGVKVIVEANMIYDKDGNALGETFVGIDNFEAAKLGGLAAGEAYADQYSDAPAKIAIISYPLEQACIDRENGFIEGFKEVIEDAEVVASQNGEAVRDKSMSVMENILTANPDVNVVFGINDDSALGAFAAMESRGMGDKELVVGFDGTDDAKTAILSDGMYFGDVVQDATLIGTECVKAAIMAVNGESLPQVTAIDASFITIEDLQ